MKAGLHVKRKSSNAQVKKWGLFGPTSTFMVAREDKKWVLFGCTSTSGAYSTCLGICKCFSIFSNYSFNFFPLYEFHSEQFSLRISGPPGPRRGPRGPKGPLPPPRCVKTGWVGWGALGGSLGVGFWGVGSHPGCEHSHGAGRARSESTRNV